MNNKLPPKFREIVDSLLEEAYNVGLDPFVTSFEIVNYKQMNEIAAYGGFPVRYPHWRWGMEYDSLSKSYNYGLSTIYELVINNDPCYAYLLDSNSLATQKTVISHVYGHSDFFKNNLWFSKTNRKMLTQMANHAVAINQIIKEIGNEKVEQFIDVCLSLENLIESQDNISSNFNELENSTSSETSDVLLFLLKNADLSDWQYKILSIIRDESYYFLPQKQTKILNEGWATYWHSEMMTKINPLSSSEIVDYCDQYSSIVYHHPGQLNPYRLGLELLRDVKDRWDKGKYGLKYLKCEDNLERKNWDKGENKGIEKLFSIRKTHNDITFIDEFLTEDFCREHNLYLYDKNSRPGESPVTSTEYKDIKENILTDLTNSGSPVIEVSDDNFNNKGELLLKHCKYKKDLDKKSCEDALKSLAVIWTKPVHIQTTIQNQEKILSSDDILK
jgi:stage V sporulation protein R